MAFWQRKSNRRVFLYYWCKSTGRQRCLSRELTRHLDEKSDEDVEQWVRNWNSNDASTHKLPKPVQNKEITQYVEQFCRHLTDDFARHPYTVKAHEDNLLRISLPFFYEEKRIVCPKEMRHHSPQLNQYLKTLGFSSSRIRNIQMSLRMFWRWLSEENVVEGSITLRRTKLQEKKTPLRISPDPDTILAWSTEDEDLRLLLLIVYFFSLRPQEAFALRRNDFLAGERSSHFEACKAMRAVGLYDRFAVRIRHQRSRRIGLSSPKANSSGIVACFDERAARAVVGFLRKKPLHAELFPYGNDWYYKAWRRRGFPELTLKDCRRASLYWLGHYSSLEISALRNHARHADITTTAMYTRRPSDDLAAFDGCLEDLID